MFFNFYMPTKVVFGENKMSELSGILKKEKVMIVTDEVLTKIGLVDRIRETIERENEVFVFDKVEPNPSCETVDEGARIARENGVTAIIGLGGGSAMDSAKAIACLIDSEGEILDYLTAQKTFVGRKCKLIAIPTTSGTGSEVTNVGVYTDKKNHQKRSFVSPYFWNDISIVDPTLTYTVPPKATASTGLDAFVHALESYWANSTQSISSSIAKEVIKLIFDNLEKAYKNGNDAQAREGMSLASLMAGLAFGQTRTTILHAISYPITNKYHLDHGFACAICMLPTIEYNYSAIKEKMDELFDYLKISSLEEFVGKLKTLMDNINTPQKISQIGGKEEDLEEMAEFSANHLLAKLNPKPLSKQDVLDIMKKVF